MANLFLEYGCRYCGPLYSRHYHKIDVPSAAVVEFLMLTVVSFFRLPYRKRLTVMVHATYTVGHILCRPKSWSEKLRFNLTVATAADRKWLVEE
jgi:hypothetical protein